MFLNPEPFLVVRRQTLNILNTATTKSSIIFGVAYMDPFFSPCTEAVSFITLETVQFLLLLP